MKLTKYKFTCEFSFEINLKKGEKLEHGIKRCHPDHEN